MKKFIKNPSKKNDPLARDLSDLIGKGNWRKVRFIMSPKDTTITIRVPQSLVDTAKKVAKKKGVKYHSMMRDALADYLAKAA